MDKKYYCQKCRGLRNHVLLFNKEKSGSEDYGSFNWTRKYQVIECAGCENHSFLGIYGDSSMMQADDNGEPYYYDDEVIYPYYLKNVEELQHKYQVPGNIRNIYVETINAFKAGALLLTAGGFRAIIEAVCNYLKIRKEILEERINLLHSKGHLTLSESKRLHSIRFLGNSALHEIETPKPEQLEILLGIINHLLSKLFINDKLMKGKLDMPMDNYDEFSKVVQNFVKEDMLGKEVKLDDLLGKSKRLLSKANYKSFREQLIKDIQDKKFDFLEIVNEEKALFKILSKPKYVFSW